MVIFTVLYFLCGISYLVMGLYSFAFDTKNRLNRHFFLMCISLAYWAILFTLKNQAADAQTASMYHVLSTFSWSTFHCMVLHFIIKLSGNGKLISKKYKVVLLYLPAVLSIYLYFFQPPTAQNFVQTNLGWIHITATDRGLLWTNFFNLYYLAYMATVIVLLVMWLDKANLVRERKQAKLILITVLFTIITGGITDLLFPVLGIPVVPPLGVILVIIPMIGILYSIVKYKLMDLNPKNFVLPVLKIMGEGLLIVDHTDTIQDINNGALKMLGYQKGQLINSPISKLFQEGVNLDRLRNCSSLEIEMADSIGISIPVLLSSAVLRDRWGDSLGTVCIFQSISEIKAVQHELMKSYDNLEAKVEERTQELVEANKSLQHEIQIQAEMEEKITRLAYYDHMTGLPNKRLFNDRLKQSIYDASRTSMTIGVLLLDIDYFKRVNDTIGHAKGDDLLRMVAKRLMSAVRASDTVCRVGGDEFLILVKNLSRSQDLDVIVEKIFDVIKLPFTISNNEIHITTSIGGAIYPTDGDDVETLIKNSDIAMYNAKEQGRNQFKLCSAGIKDSVIENLKLTNYLYRALERKEFQLYYQPQVSLTTGKITGIEALIRWIHPKMGTISPGDFIPIAEKTGLILPIGEWVIQNACLQNKAWQDSGLLNVPISVNLSVNQFQNTDIVEQVKKILRDTHLSPGSLELEITEGVVMKDREHIIESLTTIKAHGVKISIDDFGTEFSSLNYLKQLPIDNIKIDLSFTRGIGTSAKDEAIIKTIIALAKNLNLGVIAEGVETLAQVEFLKSEMCEKVQGYYFFRPMPAEQLEQVIADFLLQ